MNMTKYLKISGNINVLWGGSRCSAGPTVPILVRGAGKGGEVREGVGSQGLAVVPLSRVW